MSSDKQETLSKNDDFLDWLEELQKENLKYITEHQKKIKANKKIKKKNKDD